MKLRLLKTEDVELAQQVAELGEREYTAVNFIKKRIEDREQRINAYV